ncbi:MAG: hypothetical protein ACP5HJ_03285 [Candidatus Micrarchaeia archaeon]
MKKGRFFFILSVFFVLLAIFIILKLPAFKYPKNLTKEEAVSLINSSLHLAYPNARIEFVSVSPSKTFNNSWEIVVVVSKNPNSPCPESFVLEYDTFYGLDWKVQNNLTRNCIVFGAVNNSEYIYGRREEAMSRASQFDFVKAFIRNCSSIFVDAAPTIKNFTNAWDVVYVCDSKEMHVFISQKGGNLLGVSKTI